MSTHVQPAPSRRRWRAALTVLALAAGLVTTGTAGVGAATVDRVAGANRFATAAELARRADPQAHLAVVATGADYPDALAAGPAAARQGGVLLLATRDTLPDATAQALDDLPLDRVIIAGGTGAISSDVADAIQRVTGVTPNRVAGADRYATAARLADDLDTATTVYVASGHGFADALSGGAAAGRDGAPLLLTRPDAVPAATADALDRLAPDRIVLVGGTSAISYDVAQQLRQRTGATVDRLAGPDRFATAAAVAATFDTPSTAYLATGLDFPDGLAVTPAAARGRAPVLLAARTCLPAATADRLDAIAPDQIVLAGGTAVMTDGVAQQHRCDATPTVTTIASHLDVPWDVAFTSTGDAYLTERDTGRVLRRHDGQLTEVDRFDVDNAGEGGLLGIAVSPTDDRLLYAYMTASDGNRLVRFTPGGARTTLLAGIPKNSYHDAGRIAFGPDGMLYVTTGDAGRSSLAQDRSSLAGKILRLTPDGGVPADNPFTGSYVYALGLRDPQGIAWDAEGTLYEAEFGPDRDDEVNRITPGGNYGWPEVTGTAGDPRFIDPIIVRQPPEASWSGATFLVDSALPAWDGDLFVAAERGTRLWRFRLDGDRVVQAESLYEGRFGRLRLATQAPDGSLWLLTSNRDGRGDPTADDDRILRVAPGG